MRKYIYFSLFFIIVILAVSYGNVYQHENVHKQIAIYNGCDNYKISYFPSSYFKCYHYDHKLSIEEIKTEYMLDSLNEIVGYNVTSIYLTILICSFIICSFIFLKGETNGNDKHN